MKYLKILIAEETKSIMLIDTLWHRIIMAENYSETHLEEAKTFFEKVKTLLETDFKFERVLDKLINHEAKFSLSENFDTGWVKVGIKEKNTYHWFNYFEMFSFEHSYNQASGKTIKTYKHGRLVSMRLNERYGIEL